MAEMSGFLLSYSPRWNLQMYLMSAGMVPFFGSFLGLTVCTRSVVSEVEVLAALVMGFGECVHFDVFDRFLSRVQLALYLFHFLQDRYAEFLVSAQLFDVDGSHVGATEEPDRELESPGYVYILFRESQLFTVRAYVTDRAVAHVSDRSDR